MSYKSTNIKGKDQSGNIVIPKPDYLQNFVQFVIKHLVEYDEKVATGQSMDWRIKEALLLILCSIRDNIVGAKEIKE